tara:strand:- start:683 stop:1816 length:1134 start_codon:yes stop_codon:yes gene_type:complete
MNVAIVGIGNCASALYQGLHYYRNNTENNGLIKNEIGGYHINDINIKLAIDVDERKVGKPLSEAIFEHPNCTPQYVHDYVLDKGPTVIRGPIIDGIANHMDSSGEDDPERFKVREVADRDDEEKKIFIDNILQQYDIDILINYLPVGSQKATEFYAECCLRHNISLLNCIPVFIASNPAWEDKFIEKGIPIIGDDMKSQFGASILSQMLQELAHSRGMKVKSHIQRNVGGNTDFYNMMDKNRIISKKISKENVIKSQNTIRNIDDGSYLYAGPSEYIRYYKDNKIAHIHMDMEGFMGSPITLKAELSVIDSPNSAGIVMDAIRYLKTARDMGMKGSLRGPSAFTQKSPPLQMEFKDALRECELLSKKEFSEITEKQR